MKLILALIIGFAFLAMPVMAEDADDKPNKEEKKKKGKKKMPEELMKLRKEIMAKVKAGDLTKEQGKEEFKKAMTEFRKNNPKKDGDKKKGDKKKDDDK
jgi:hypothetical protein